MWHGVPFACQRRPIVGVLRMCWLLPGSFDCFCCPHTSVHRPSIACLAVFLRGPGALFLHALSGPSTICPFPTHGWSAPDGTPRAPQHSTHTHTAFLHRKVLHALRGHCVHICCRSPHCIPVNTTAARGHQKRHQDTPHHRHHLLRRPPHAHDPMPLVYTRSRAGPDQGHRHLRWYKTFERACAVRAKAFPKCNR